MTDEKISERIAQLKRERDQFVTQANLQVAAFNGGIQALEQLLDPSLIPVRKPDDLFVAPPN